MTTPLIKNVNVTLNGYQRLSGAKFRPETSMEKAVQDILQGSGYDESTMAKAAAEGNDEGEGGDSEVMGVVLEGEEKEMRMGLGLMANEASAEAVKKRKAQLAKLRTLMFYHEQKQKRVRKIKSKGYHR